MYVFINIYHNITKAFKFDLQATNRAFLNETPGKVDYGIFGYQRESAQDSIMTSFKNFGENEKDPNTYGYSSFCGFEPKHCVWGDIALNSISDIELLSFSKQDMEELKYGDKRHNHLNEQNNKNLSNFIIDVIKEDNFTPRKIKMDEYFKDI